MTDKPPPQWALDKAGVVPGYLMLNVSDFTKKSVVAMIASLLAEERERCAKIVENYAESFTLYSYEARALGYVARKIREP